MGLAKRLAWVVAGAALCAGPMAARAQVLADRVPGDAIVYIGWRGANDLGAGYAGSNMKGLLDNTNLREQVEGLIARGLADAGKEDAKKREDAKRLKVLLDAMWKYPAAVYFGGMDVADANQPQPKLAVVVEAGAEAAGLVDVLNKGIAENPDKKTPAAAKVVGKYVLLSIGKPEGVEGLLGGAQDMARRSLSTDKEFLAALGQVQKGAVVTTYVNAHGLVQMIGEMEAAKTPQGSRQNWPKVVDALVLNAFESVIWTGDFDGKLWASQGFVGVDKNQMGAAKGWQGLAMLLDNKPLTEETLGLIPKSATWAGVVRFDGARVLNEVRDAADRASENGGKQFEMMLKQAPNFIGVDAKDLCDSLGDEWVYYGTADAVGNSLRGATVVNHLRNDKNALADLQDLEDFINGRMGQRGPDAATWKTSKVTSKVAGVGELEVHSLALPQMTPSWTVAGGNFVFSLSPQGVQSAVEGLAQKGASIAENGEFAALRKKLEAGANGAKITSFTYTDLAKTAPEAYEFINLINAAIAKKAGDKGLAFTMPALEQIKPYLSAAGSISWTDDAGWHVRSLAPFPGAKALGGPQLLMEMAASKLGDRVGAARGAAVRASTASSLHQVGLGLMTYATENQTLPPDLGTLVVKDYISGDAQGLKVFVAPRTAVPDEVAKGTKAEQANWVNANTRFVYLGAGKKLADIKDAEKTPLAYEKLDAPGTAKGIVVLFADGHVETVARDKAEAMFTK